MRGIIKNAYFRIGVLGLLCFITGAFCFFLPDAKVSNECGVVVKLPERVPGFYSVAVEMSEQEVEWLPIESTSFVKRHYYPVGSDRGKTVPVSLSLIASEGDERTLHRPEVCLTGQGWQIPTKQVRTFELDGETIEVMDLFLKRESNGVIKEAHYYFFWVGRGINTSQYRDMKLYSLWDNFTKNLNHRWAYPAVMVHVNPADNEQRHEKSWNLAEYFLTHALPVFHKEFGAEEE